MSRPKIAIVPLSQLPPRQLADCFALLAERVQNATREGKPFYTCRFRDRDRSVTCMVWADSPWFDACESEWREGQCYKLRCVLTEHERYGPQIELYNIRPVNDGDRADGFDRSRLVPVSRLDPHEVLAELLHIAHEHIEDEPLRRLVVTLLDRHGPFLAELPASDKFYPFYGGWLEHVWSVTRNCLYLVNHYRHHYADAKPPLNRDLVLAAALLHDIGNQVARAGHETYSVMLAQPLLARLLPDLYPDPVQAQVLTGFILSAIASHDCSPAPVTLEGAIVAVADGADMTRGRGQVAFDQGKADIHAVSAMAIQEVRIGPGDAVPIHIEITMTDSAGLFQVERLLGQKLVLSGLDRYVSLRACVVPDKAKTEQTIHCLILDQGRFRPEGLSQPVDETTWPVDPVCGMTVAPEQAAGAIVYRAKRYLFCSTACLSRFQDAPSCYLQGA